MICEAKKRMEWLRAVNIKKIPLQTAVWSIKKNLYQDNGITHQKNASIFTIPPRLSAILFIFQHCLPYIHIYEMQQTAASVKKSF